MSSPTDKQQTAIDKENNNIIVSAGAGSGKTFVLKERVLRIVKSGKSIKDLIILTFTNAAALEMKNRIRKILTKNNLPDAELVDSAYITTFDSFSHSLVKKYNYLLNIDKDFTIIDKNIVNTELKNILNDIFENKYKQREPKFINLINHICYKNDDELRKCIINSYRNLQNITDRTTFLDTYIDKYFSDSFIEERLDEFENNIFVLFDDLKEKFYLINELALNDDVSSTNDITLEQMNNVTTMDELLDNLDTFKPTKDKRAYDEDYPNLKKQFDDIKSKIKSVLIYSRKDNKNYYLSTKEDVEVIIDILKELDNRIMKFKDDRNAYEFIDIEYKAIDLVKNHKDIQDELKKTHEIMIDEYQDTNDIQEEFISYIQNNNVYMVGDVKQSIYGFRNANPYIFKDKYDNYSKDNGGIKIDLDTNFRSRQEVIKNINDIFSSIMYDNIGGADYKNQHIMLFGKDFYEKNKDNGVDYNLSLLNYKYDKTYGYSKAEIEAFMIANDIEEKMKQKRHTYHEVNGKDEFIDMTYKDFCILVDKSTNFELLSKVLEYKGIPVFIDKDLSIKEDDEIYILKNLISLLICMKNNDLTSKFEHSYASIARSYISRISDNELYEIIKNKKYKDTDLYKTLLEIVPYIDTISNKELLYMLLDKFDFINKTTTIGDVKNRITVLESFINQADSLNKFGMDIYTLEEHFDTILSSDEEDIEVGAAKTNVDAVRIMTIHGSKGLEFNYVYMPYLDSAFKFKEKGNIYLNNKYGIVAPFYDDGYDKTFINHLSTLDNTKEVISEKIRLFYVAITRAKEQFIMISEFNDKLYNNNSIDEHDLLSVKSFTDIITLLKNYLTPYTNTIDIEKINITKDYQLSKSVDYRKLIDKSNEKIIINELNIDSTPLENAHFSKSLSSIVDQEFKDLLDYGTKMHECFEIYDFNNDNLDKLSISDEYKDNIRTFLQQKEVENIAKAKVYKEHEIRYNKDGSIYSGVIDLLVEYDDHFDIIDYKLSNIDSKEYEKQLNGYKDYIEQTYNKPTNIYLYSIKQGIFKKLGD